MLSRTKAIVEIARIIFATLAAEANSATIRERFRPDQQ